MNDARIDEGAIAVEPKPEVRGIRLDLPAETYRLLRLVAADEDTSMSGYLRDMIERHLNAEGESRGFKR